MSDVRPDRATTASTASTTGAPESAAGTDTVVAEFRSAFGREPDGVFSAPGRVNLIGEHTDYNEGHVLPFAIDRRCWVAAGRRADGVVTLRSAQAPDELVTSTLADLASARGWSAYALGTVWALAEAGLARGGVDLVVAGDVPLGAGLSSSAALESAVGLAVTVLTADPTATGPTADPTDAVRRGEPDRWALVAAGRRAENDVVGAPVGIMDQAASLLCREGAALLLDCRSLETADVDLGLDAAGLATLVIDTRVRHDLADGGYADRRAACQAAADALGVPALRDASLADVDTLPEPLRRRARHVVTEGARVLAVVELLRDGRPAEIGPVLTASHTSLRDDFAISTIELDTAVDVALDGGALGARMVGGGFGGSVLALVPSAAVPSMTDAVVERFARAGWTAPVVREVAPSAAARRER